MTSTSNYINEELRAKYRPLLLDYWNKASEFERKGIETKDANYIVLAKHNRDLAKGILDYIKAEEAKANEDNKG